MSTERHIQIFDTTLRDGQQCPGAGITFEQNLEYASLVADLRVDVVEAGFPAAGALDFKIVKTIAELYAALPQAPTIAALCQLRDEQIDITIESLLPAVAAGRARLHTYVPVAPELLRASLGEKADLSKIAKDVFAFVKRAVDAGLQVEFSPEGYSRMAEHFDFTTDLIRAAIEGGATVINCPDTIGGACQYQGEEYFVRKMQRHAEIVAREYPDRAIVWSAHCHNDFGLAVQNSVNAVVHGPARQIEGCFNGIGERAGNAALEAVLMVIRHFGADAGEGDAFYTTVDVSKLQTVCDFVSRNMLRTQAHWPISGANAARHSSGGHTNAILRNPLAYQPFDPKEIGKDIAFVFGPLSGGTHAKSIIEQAGYVCSEDEKAAIAQFVKDKFSERRKGITDDELLHGYFCYRSPVQVSKFNYSRTADTSGIELEGQFFDRSGTIVETHQGHDSALAALKTAVDRYLPCDIQSHRSQSGGAGYSAVSLSTIVIIDARGNLYEGNGEDRDIEISAMKAFIDAVNNAYVQQHFRK